MTKLGFIREVKGNMAYVRFLRESACGGNCSSCGGCASKPFDKWIENTLSLSVGDKVEVETENKKILFLAFMVYILPLSLFFISALAFSYFYNETIGTILGVAVFFLSFIITKKYGDKSEVIYQMIKKVD